MATQLEAAGDTGAVDFEVTALVLKVASRCNLNCTYCYVYNQGDNTSRDQPHFMSPRWSTALLQRTRQHCLAPAASS